MEIIGVLMMTHMIEPEALLTQAKIFEDYGADIVYCMDSAGHLLPDGVRARVGLLAEKLNIPVGFHAHNNLGLAMCNTMAALMSAPPVDGTLKGLGGRRRQRHDGGDRPAVLNRAGYRDQYRPVQKSWTWRRTYSPRCCPTTPPSAKPQLTIGYAAFYGSFALHAERAGQAL
jgi:4-hydroxy 2-oxovalerate aldolase